jgi:hypothetical protein
LQRYTLRYDIIYPDRNENGEPAWAVTQPFNYDGSWPPFAQARRDGATGLAQTFSITLDQIPSWGDSVEGAPVMVFIAQGDFDATGEFTLYYDNFRLIDTGGSGGAPPHIDSITVDSKGKVVITWTGGGALQWSPSLTAPQWNVVTGATSGAPIDPPVGGIAFYRIAAQ